MSPKQLLEKFTSAFSYDAEPDGSVIKASVTDINEFLSFVKKAITLLKD